MLNPVNAATLDSVKLVLLNELATRHLGEALAPCVSAGFVMTITGDLGAGKTTLTRALLRQLGVEGTLRSPTYALLEPYEQMPCLGGGTLYHFDFYRLEQTPLAWKDAGFETAFELPNAAIIEWPEYALGLPTPALHIHLQHTTNGRAATLTINDGAFNTAIKQAMASFAPMQS
jgi:tRNA threonylcarbamoyladenosine biosynthesis protein TsaE